MLIMLCRDEEARCTRGRGWALGAVEMDVAGVRNEFRMRTEAWEVLCAGEAQAPDDVGV